MIFTVFEESGDPDSGGSDCGRRDEAEGPSEFENSPRFAYY